LEDDFTGRQELRIARNAHEQTSTENR
jgi:hypothetical protein